MSHATRSRRPRVLLFDATPAALPAAGGTVELSALVSGAKRCRFSSGTRLAHLPHTAACGSGRAGVSVRIAANGATGSRDFSFELRISGHHGHRRAPKVTVVESGTGSVTSPGGQSQATSPSTTVTTSPITQVAPVVTGDPSSATVDAGQTASFSASASGSPSPSAQWEVSTDGGTSWSQIGGAT
ncbi:MAG TPA: hypothetical protein VL977_00505, partial [Solirubrobacteraceae bacterium]|nr:hypothetical protein [Solirubrobacteraceae bacterium]